MAQIGPVNVPQSTTPQDAIPAFRELPELPARPAFAGFWLRAAAYLIDTILMSPIVGLAVSFYPTAFLKNPVVNPDLQFALPQPTPLAFALVFFTASFYFTFFEASGWQATPGKRILKLYVTNLNGQRLTLAQAAFRNFPKILLSLIFVFVHIVAGLTEKKQALHDILAGTLVLRRP